MGKLTKEFLCIRDDLFLKVFIQTFFFLFRFMQLFSPPSLTLVSSILLLSFINVHNLCRKYSYHFFVPSGWLMFDFVTGKVEYRVTEESLMDRLNTDMHAPSLSIDKECRLGTFLCTAVYVVSYFCWANSMFATFFTLLSPLISFVFPHW